MNYPMKRTSIYLVSRASIYNLCDAVRDVTQAGDFQTIKNWAVQHQNDNELDDATPYYDFGISRYSNPQTIHYMSSRTNNFTVRVLH